MGNFKTPASFLMPEPSAPPLPDYKGAALATANANKFSDQNPFGAVNWSLRPGADPNNPQPGDYVRSTTLAPEQQQLYDLGVGNQLAAGRVGTDQLSALMPDARARQQLQDTLYRRSTQYYDENFGRQEEALRSRLLNSGLAEGSAAYKNDMGSFDQTRNLAYADAADRAVLGAEQQTQTNQNNAVSRLAQLLALSKGQVPQAVNSGLAGPDYSAAAGSAYQAALGASNAKNASNAANTDALMNALMLMMI